MKGKDLRNYYFFECGGDNVEDNIIRGKAPVCFISL